MLFLAGLPWKVMITGAVAFGASLPFVWNVLHDYQRKRVLTLIDPSSDRWAPATTSSVDDRHRLRRPHRQGWLSGTQTHLEFIPERTTDFIFAVYAEEFGLLGNLILLALYLLVIGRGLMIAAKAPHCLAA